ncbi:MAG: hypothetical protein WCI94_06135 [Rhodospirillales bacterium]
MKALCALLLASSGLAQTALAQEVSLNGRLDFRLVAPSGENSNFDGGLGKFRWGDGGGSPVIPDLGGAVLRGSILLTPELRAVAEIRYDPRQKTALDVLDAYLRWRPISTGNWRWTGKIGAFYAPISLENTGIGWTTEWTITPSAINGWIGQELRTIGAESTLEWRGEVDRFELVGALFGLNEPAGETIDSYGWTFNDRPTGLLDHLRIPERVQSYSHEFRQFDHSVGYYAGLAWDRPDFGRLALLYYDNLADPKAHDSYEFNWRTEFWSLGYSTEIGPIVVLAQALGGSTTIAPAPSFVSRTDFWSYYVLAGIEHGAWRYAIRFDQFGTTGNQPGSGVKADERGIAGTVAVTWTPRKGISLVGEVLTVDYNRPLRATIGKAAHATETQAQIALRIGF